MAAPYFGLTADRGVEVLAQIDTAVASWRTIASSNGIPEHEQRLFADVLPGPPRAGGSGVARRSASLQAGALDTPAAPARDAAADPEALPRSPGSLNI